MLPSIDILFLVDGDAGYRVHNLTVADEFERQKVENDQNFQILAKIILPVSVPGIATISLFYALGYWNQWFNAMLYIEESDLFPLQYLLMRMLRNVEAMRLALDKAGIESRPLWKPMHRQPVYKANPAYLNGVSENLFKQGLCLPSGPCVTDEDVERVVKVIKEVIK